MTGDENNGNFSLDMTFDEALGRYEQTDPKELHEVMKDTIPEATIEGLIDAFEACAKKTKDAAEFWYARDLQKLLEYEKWSNFSSVIEKAINACRESGHEPEDHFAEVGKMVEIGSGSKREVADLMISRYGSYLVTQNADSRKRPVAFGQTYFAIQARRQEIADQEKAVAVPMSEDEERVFLRNQIKQHNKHLASAAKGAGVVTPQEFAIFQSHGYQGLYGKTVPEIRRHKGLTKRAHILDRMGSTELAANFFRVTQTEEKLRKENVQGTSQANRTHYEVGRQVREAMLKISGTAPENLPAAEAIGKAEKRLKTAAKTPSAEIEPQPSTAPEIDINRDLWKYALLVMVQRPNMEISTSELIRELPNYIAVPDDVAAPSASRRDSKFSQLVRNLKSHKDAKTNFIRQGYAEAIPRGFRATEKGKKFVLDFFKDRL